MSVATTDAKSAEEKSDSPAEVLRKAAPLSRESLYSEEVVTALWEEAEENDAVGAASVYECAEVFRAFDHSPAHTYEIATALDYHDVCSMPNQQTSAAFRAELERHE